MWLFFEPKVRSPSQMARNGSVFDLGGTLSDRDGTNYLAA
jgi:hypothetical protein